MLIEQAIFASVQNDRAWGYQLAAKSSGISEADARELSVWGPSHDSLLPGLNTSTGFHQLTSGAYCVSFTQLAGAEYSGRGGEAVYTNMLLVPAEVLERFANDPFAIVRAASAKGALEVGHPPEKALEPLKLTGKASAVDQELVAQLAREPGPAVFATWLQAALSSSQLAVAWHGGAETLIAGLFSLLPVECRPDFSFTTGLKHSPSRQTRLQALAADQTLWRAIARQGVALLNLDLPQTPEQACHEGWAAYVESMLSGGRISALASQLERRRSWLNSGNLSILCEQLQAKPSSEPVGRTSPDRSTQVATGSTATSPAAAVTKVRSDPAHRKTVAAAAAESKPSLHPVSELLAVQPPEVVETLERIDDLVFAAISGSETALADLKALWPAAMAQIDQEVLEQTVRQYLRCALSICNPHGPQQAQRPERALAAIDVLGILFDA